MIRSTNLRVQEAVADNKLQQPTISQFFARSSSSPFASSSNSSTNTSSSNRKRKSSEKRKPSHVSIFEHPDRVRFREIEKKYRQEEISDDKNDDDENDDENDNDTGNHNKKRKKRRVVLEDYSPEGLRQLWTLASNNFNYNIIPTKNAFESSSECWIWKSYKKQGKGGLHDNRQPPYSDELGYPVITRGKGRAKLKVIQLATYSKYNRVVQIGENASHLCHTPMCINPAHLVIESADQNKARNCCPCWSYQQGTNIKQLICSHQPPCLRPDEKGLTNAGLEQYPHASSGVRIALAPCNNQ